MEIKKTKISESSNRYNYFYMFLPIMVLITHITHTNPSATLKEKLCNLMLFPIASSSSSEKTQEKATAISQHFDPKAKVTIKNLNTLGRLLVGYKNTISLPFINYVLVNEEWLKTLPPKAEEFVMARGMMYLFSNPYQYVSYKYLFPFLLSTLCININAYIEQFEGDITLPKKQLIYYLTEAISYLLSPYYLRKIEYKFDAKTAIKFNCFDGGIAALLDSIKFSHDGLRLDKINSQISGVETLDLATTIVSFYGKLDLGGSGLASTLIRNFFKPIKIDESYYPLYLFLSPSFLIPGRFSDRQSAFFNAIKNLPLVNLMFDYPKPYKRIRELTELRNKILKDKIQEEKKAAK